MCCILRFLANVSDLTNAEGNLQSVSHTRNQARVFIWRIIYRGISVCRGTVDAELANDDPSTNPRYHNYSTGVFVLNEIYKHDNVLQQDQAIFVEALSWWQDELTRISTGLANGPSTSQGSTCTHEQSLYTDLSGVLGRYARLASQPV